MGLTIQVPEGVKVEDCIKFCPGCGYNEHVFEEDRIFCHRCNTTILITRNEVRPARQKSKAWSGKRWMG